MDMGISKLKFFCCQTIFDPKKWVFVNQIENKTGPFFLIGPKIALTEEIVIFFENLFGLVDS